MSRPYVCVWRLNGNGKYVSDCRPDIENYKPVFRGKGYGYCKWCGGELLFDEEGASVCETVRFHATS